jgi:hypothetical protein
MVSFAFWLLTATVAIGVMMATGYLGRARLLARPTVPILHGLLGLAGLAVLVIALRGGAAAGSDRYGTAPFAPAAAVLAGFAVIVGLIVARLGRRPGRKVGFLIGAHATLAVTAYALLLAFDWLR